MKCYCKFLYVSTVMLTLCRMVAIVFIPCVFASIRYIVYNYDFLKYGDICQVGADRQTRHDVLLFSLAGCRERPL